MFIRRRIFVAETNLKIKLLALSCWQPTEKRKKKNLTDESLRLVKMERYTIEQRVFIIEQYFKDSLLYLIQILR